MGWAHCGEDSNGREIGYCIEAKCDHPGCSEDIHRGLAYVCGDMHGEDEYSCEQYFCGKHQMGTYPDDLVDELVDDIDIRKFILKHVRCVYWMYERSETCLACQAHNEKHLREEILEMEKEFEKAKS